MGWDRKKRGASTGYFYESVRTPDGVKKKYLGRRTAGQVAAAVLEYRQQARRDAKTAVLGERAETADAEHLADELADWADLLSTAWLIASGHHIHHGEWRKKRAEEESP